MTKQPIEEIDNNEVRQKKNSTMWNTSLKKVVILPTNLEDWTKS